MSCQPRPQPQANGIAATSASIGMPTNTPTRMRCTREVCASSMSGRAARLTGAGPATGRVAIVVVPVLPLVPRASGVVVMVLPEVGDGGRKSLIRLRNRSLRYRRLRKGLTIISSELPHGAPYEGDPHRLGI